MSVMLFFPGQVEELIFTLEQVKVLASPSVNQIFWAFDAQEPLSARDVAQQIGRSAQSVHFHLTGLITTALILCVGERKRHARTEKLYVRAGVKCIDQGVKGAPEYKEYRKKAFAATLRRLIRGQRMVSDLSNSDPSVYDFVAFERSFLQLDRKDILELKSRVATLLDEYARKDVDPTAPKTMVFSILQPQPGQLRKWAHELGVSVDDESED